MQHVTTPAFAHTGYIRQFIDEPGGHQESARADHTVIVEGDGEASFVVRNRADPTLHQLPAIAADLRSSELQHLQRIDPVTGQEPVCGGRWRVARFNAVDPEYRAARAPAQQRPAQAGGATANDHHIVRMCHVVHQIENLWQHHRSPGPLWQGFLLIRQNTVMDGSLDKVLATVGPRLRALRQQRDMTLADLSTATGISVSTLSRLESGQRRPNLELLLPLAQAHQVPLDELIGAPANGDPRIHAQPFTRKGMTVLPLTRRTGGLQAYKLVIPTRRARQQA